MGVLDTWLLNTLKQVLATWGAHEQEAERKRVYLRVEGPCSQCLFRVKIRRGLMLRVLPGPAVPFCWPWLMMHPEVDTGSCPTSLLCTLTY